jgi:hypothetical protein
MVVWCGKLRRRSGGSTRSHVVEGGGERVRIEEMIGRSVGED